MLKIKDNVDLKELEKFKFKERGTDYIRKINNDEWDNLIIDKEDKIIFRMTEVFDTYEFDDDVMDFIKDLIKADLVEKVKDE